MDIRLKKDNRQKYNPECVDLFINLDKIDITRLVKRKKGRLAKLTLIRSDLSNNDYFIVQEVSEEEKMMGEKNINVGIAYIKEWKNNE